MIQTLILEDFKTLDGRHSAARGGQRAATPPSTSTLRSWHTGNQQKQTNSQEQQWKPEAAPLGSRAELHELWHPLCPHHQPQPRGRERWDTAGKSQQLRTDGAPCVKTSWMFSFATSHATGSRAVGFGFSGCILPPPVFRGCGVTAHTSSRRAANKAQASPGRGRRILFYFFHLWFSPYISSLSFYILIYYFCIYLPYKRCMKVSTKQIKQS